jgi:hypothetical protein
MRDFVQYVWGKEADRETLKAVMIPIQCSTFILSAPSYF